MIMRLQEIKENIKNCTDEYVDNALFVKDIQYLINLVETMRAEEPNFWDLYDRYQDKIAEKLQLRDKVEKYKKALEEITEIPIANGEISAGDMWSIAEKALKDE